MRPHISMSLAMRCASSVYGASHKLTLHDSSHNVKSNGRRVFVDLLEHARGITPF